MFDKLIGNDQVKEILGRLVRTGRVPHSLLLTGKDGVGKKQFALEVARSFVCLSPGAGGEACGSCRNCQRAVRFDLPSPDKKDDHEQVVFSEHPDIGMIVPYRTNILVNAVRDLEREANFLPFEADARIFLIDEADKMNDSATNALLKTLEEPAEKTYIFLVTARPSMLLPTVLSRCQTIRFAPVGAADIESHLLAERELPTEDARLLARISRGSIARALEIDLERYYQRRLKMLDVLRSLGSGRNYTILLRTAEELADPKNKEHYESDLETLRTVVHDIWLLRNAPDAEIVNFDIRENLARHAGRTPNRILAAWLTEIEELTENLRSNLNRKIATDALFMRMAAPGR